MTDFHQPLAHFDSQYSRHLDQLKSLVAIPSISFSGFPRETLIASAKKTKQILEAAGLEHARILTVAGSHPYVYADWLHAPGRPTVVLYAHHDVQPVMDLKKWKSPPFQATVRNGRLYGRGTADDKGAVVVHAASVAAYLKTVGRLPVNVKVIVEGEEECGSGHFNAFLKQYRKMLAGDVLIIMDSENLDTGVPSITTTLRGLVAMEVEVRSLEHPQHSGAWGGPLPDPILGLSRILAALMDGQGRITIPGLTQGMIPLTPAERKQMARLPVTVNRFREHAGLLPSCKIVGGPGSVYEKLWRLPSLTVTSMQSGARTGVGNVVMDSAWARVTVRLAPGMDPDHVREMLCKKIKSACPWGMELTLKSRDAAQPLLLKTSHPAYAAAQRALAAGFGKKPVFVGCGGSIPLVKPFSDALGGAPALILGITDPLTAAHAENESLCLDDFKKAVRSQIHLFQELVAGF